MSMPALDEQFLPRLVSVFHAIFHPTEGPKVVYQVPEGSIVEDPLGDRSDSEAKQSRAHKQGENQKPKNAIGGEPLFDFSALSEYFIPKAPLCGRLVTTTARGISRKERDEDADKEAPLPPFNIPGRSSSKAPSSRASSVKPPSDREPISSANPRSYKVLGYPVLIEDASRYRRNNFIFNLCFVFDGQADVRAYEPVVRKCGRVLCGLEESQSFLSNPHSRPRMYAIIEQLFEDLNSYCETFCALPDAPHTSYIKTASPHSFNRFASPMIGPNDYISLGASAASLREDHHRKLLSQHLRHIQTPAAGGKVSPSSEDRRSRASFDADSAGSVLSPLSPLRPDVVKRTVSGISSPSASQAPRYPSSPSAQALISTRRPSLPRAAIITALTEASPTPASPASPSLSLISKAATEGRFASLGRVSAEKQSDLARELTAAEDQSSQIEGTGSGVHIPFSTRRSSGGSSANAGGGNSQMADNIVSLRTIDAALSNSINASRHDDSETGTKAGIAEKREPPHGLGRTVRDAINLKLFPTYSNPPPVNDWDVPVALLDLGSRVDGNWDLTMVRIFPFIDGVNHVKRIAELADADLDLTRSCMEHLLYYGCIIMIDIFQYFNMYTLRPAIARMADDEAMGRECALYVTRPGYSLPSYPELLRLYSLLRSGKNLHDWIEDNDVDAKGIDVRRFVSFGVIQGFLRRVHRYPVYLAPSPPEDTEASIISTVKNSPMFKSVESKLRRDQTASREVSGLSVGGSQRVLCDGSRESPRGRSRSPQRRTASDFGPIDDVTPNQSTSPTKHMNPRMRRQNHRHPTATVMEVSTVAFEAKEESTFSRAGIARSPKKRISTPSISQPIPPGLAEMLDGTRCDDELCITFRVGWPDMERMLIALGTGEENQSEFKRSAGGSGSSRNMSGFGSAIFKGANSSGVHSARMGNNDSSIVMNSGSGWGAESEEAAAAGWSSFVAIDRQAIEAGDLGKVKVLLQ